MITPQELAEKIYTESDNKLLLIESEDSELTLKDFFSDILQIPDESLKLLVEYNCYNMIPGTNNSYRIDKMNRSTITQKHATVYAKPDGKGRELYAVNYDGSGHDGSSGMPIPPKHAEHFRRIGFRIPSNNIIESVSIDALKEGRWRLIFS